MSPFLQMSRCSATPLLQCHNLFGLTLAYSHVAVVWIFCCITAACGQGGRAANGRGER